MPKFRVQVIGKGFALKVRHRYLFFFTRQSVQNVGFYATRFVDTDDANHAIEKAIKLVEVEARERLISNVTSSIEISAISEDVEGFDTLAPGSGFTIFSTDDADSSE